MIRAVVAVFLFCVGPVGYSATVECSGSDYERGLCFYAAGEWTRAESLLAEVVDDGREEQETLKAMYFLARTKMQTKQWDEASRLWMRLFDLSPAFYREWNGDYLLGVCRRELGLG